MTTQGEEWNDSEIDRDMKELLTVRGTVMTVLEQARIDKYVSNVLKLEIASWFPIG